MLKSKEKRLVILTQNAAAYAAFRGEHKPTPSDRDWNKLVQLIGKSGSYDRVPWAYGVTLKPVWTAAYKAAQKGHVPGKSIKVPAKTAKPTISKSSNETSSKSSSKIVNENSTKSDLMAALAALTKAVEAL